MSAKFQSVRGMRDVLPDEVATWQHVEQVVRGVLSAYAYKEVRLPVVEVAAGLLIAVVSGALFLESLGRAV